MCAEMAAKTMVARAPAKQLAALAQAIRSRSPRVARTRKAGYPGGRKKISGSVRSG
jgi:hypothetical protein